MTGLSLIGAYCLLASIFPVHFSKLHLSLPFLNFPIFIGEILLFICLLIAVGLIVSGRIKLNIWHRLFFLYLSSILIWTVCDYFRMDRQALAFRNAVLFFYPVFAFFMYSFYRPFFVSPHKWALMVIVLFLAGFMNKLGYFSFIYFIMLLVVLFARVSNPWRYILGMFFVALWPYASFLSGARTWLVSSSIATFYYIFMYARYFSNVIKGQKILMACLCGVFFLTGAVYFADKGGLKTLLTPLKSLQNYKEVKEIIREKESSFVPQKLAVNLYNPLPSEVRNISLEEPNFWELFSLSPTAVSMPVEQIQRNVPGSAFHAMGAGQDIRKNDQPAPSITNGRTRSRSEEIAYNNITFRVLIWEDMLRELWRKKSLFGVGMGWPQRSKNIEIMTWASTEWSRDGWITPHNSFLHLIYRAGIVGLVAIIVIFTVLAGLVRDFIKARSWTGILLSGMIIYGLMAANFLLILELPYYAIPFWTLFGLTLAYRRDLLHAA